MKEVGLSTANIRYFLQLHAHRFCEILGRSQPHEQSQSLSATLGRCCKTGPVLA
jgi:hypothetical protein